MLWDRCSVCLSVTLVYCGQTVGRIKMSLALGTDVGLDPGDIVLDGYGKGHSSPSALFGPMSVVAKQSPISATAELLFVHCHTSV